MMNQYGRRSKEPRPLSFALAQALRAQANPPTGRLGMLHSSLQRETQRTGRMYRTIPAQRSVKDPQPAGWGIWERWAPGRSRNLVG